MAAPQCTSAVWTLMSEGGLRCGQGGGGGCRCLFGHFVRMCVGAMRLCGFGPHSVPPTNCGARADPFARPPAPLPGLRHRRPPLHSPSPLPLFSGGEHPPNSAVLGRTLCAAFPAVVWEGRRGAKAALVEQGDPRPTLTSPKPFPQRMGSTKQTFSFEILRPVRTPGSTVRCIYSAFMATPRRPPPPPHTLRLRGPPLHALSPPLSPFSGRLNG